MESIEIRGQVRRILWRAEDGADLALLELEDGEGASRVCRGALSAIEAGQSIRAVARLGRHPRYGERLEVSEFEVVPPSYRRGTLSWLQDLPGIGERRALAVWDKYGPRGIAVLSSNPENVLEEIGVPQAQREATIRVLRRRIADAPLSILLRDHGLGRHARAIKKAHGSARQALAALRADPWALTQIHGIAFPSSDRIALALGCPVDAPRRYGAALVYALEVAEDRGHSYLPEDGLQAALRRLVARPPSPTVLEAAIESRVRAGHLVRDDGRIYRAPRHADEVRLARAVQQRLITPGLARAVRRRPGLTAEQRDAVERALTLPLSVCTGGPGTGKTTMVRAITSECARHRLRLALCAPTGRAARRLSEAAGHEAFTLHRLLGWRPGRAPERRASKPIPADVVVVDEASMLTLEQAAWLFDATPLATSLVLVGDVDQLGPVGAGEPLAELIGCGRVETTRLRHVHRQAAGSQIVQAAHALTRGEVPQAGGDFHRMHHERADRALEGVVRAVTVRLPEVAGVDPRSDVLVLAPTYAGPLGVDALNTALTDALNAGEPEVMSGAFRINQRVMAVRGDDDLGLVNGEIGYVRADRPRSRTFDVAMTGGAIVPVAYRRARELFTPAWATAIHKAQGSEAAAVVVVLEEGQRQFLREQGRALIYTALTRGRRAVVLVGSDRLIREALTQAVRAERYSGLADRLAQMVPSAAA